MITISAKSAEAESCRQQSIFVRCVRIRWWVCRHAPTVMAANGTSPVLWLPAAMKESEGK